MPEKHRDRIQDILQRLAIEVHDRPQRAPLLDPVLRWIEEGKWMQMRYRSHGGEFLTLIKPVRIDSDRGRWRVWAWSEGLERFFYVDRITVANACEPPEDASEPLPYDHPSHPTVRVRLTKAGISRLEQDKHFGPRVAGLKPPATVEFRCPPSELDWYSRFLGGMAPDVIVEEPEELILLIRDRAEALLQAYSRSEE